MHEFVGVVSSGSSGREWSGVVGSGRKWSGVVVGSGREWPVSIPEWSKMEWSGVGHKQTSLADR